MTDDYIRTLDRELKKGSAEFLILTLLEARPRHGYELSKLIHVRSRGHRGSTSPIVRSTSNLVRAVGAAAGGGADWAVTNSGTHAPRVTMAARVTKPPCAGTGGGGIMRQLCKRLQHAP